jgi:hypothetical protein
MAKIINQTPEESALYRDALKLVKRANSRLLRMERATGSKGTFASKQLYDYLDSSTLNAVTSTGRISMKKSYTPNQIRAIQKATKEFLGQETSTVRGAKKYQKQVSKQAGKPISLLQASDIFITRRNYQWIFEYMTESEFWTFVRVAKENGWDRETFIDELSNYITNIPDEDLRIRIGLIYDYVMED